MKIATNFKDALTSAARARALIGSRAPIASAVLLALGAQGAHAASTYIVGTCQAGTQFKTIQSALNASPAPTTVDVCPGTYFEQLNISHPVTLQGITAANGALVQIDLPAGYKTNALLKAGGGNVNAVAQIYVNNVTGGSVNLSNLVVNGEGFGTPGIFFIGVAYQQSSGTINHVMTTYQDENTGAKNVVGWGVYIDGGSTNPTVTVENSTFNTFTEGGIYATGETETGEDVTVNILNNFISAATEGSYGISLSEGVNATVSGNVINGTSMYGILLDLPKGSITGNTIVNSVTGIEYEVDGPSVTSNNIYNTQQQGIFVSVPSMTVGKIQNNIISGVGGNDFDNDGTGIDLNCHAFSSSQISSNTVMNAVYGYGSAHTGFSTTGNYFGVVTEIGTCGSAAASTQKVTAAQAKVQLGSAN